MSILYTIDFDRASDADWGAALAAAAVVWREREQRGNEFARGKAATCKDIRLRVMVHGFASDRQKAYARKLIEWVRGGPIERGFTPANTTSAPTPASSFPSIVVNDTVLLRIRRLFQAATEHGIQRPAIHLQVGSPLSSRGVVRLRITLAPRHGHNPNDIYITNGGRTRAERTYIGCITPTGEFVTGLMATNDQLAAVRAFGNDPLGIARAHGRATGACCFCRRALTDARSVAMGYGPVCADHFGLEWGDQRASSVVELNRQGEVALEQGGRAQRNIGPGAIRNRQAPSSLNYDDEDKQFE